jgi:probable addiction module antidote protein
MGNRSVSYHDDLIERLKDPEERVAYVNAALIDGDPKILLSVLEDCVEAMGGVPKLAKQVHVSPQAVYKMFSDKGNPRWTNLNRILETLGFRINVSLTKRKTLAHV